MPSNLNKVVIAAVTILGMASVSSCTASGTCKGEWSDTRIQPSYEELRDTALEYARRMGLLSSQFQYNVFLSYPDNPANQDTVVVEFCPNEAAGFDGAVRIPVSITTGRIKVSDEDSRKPQASVFREKIFLSTPIEFESEPNGETGSMTVRQLALRIANGTLPRNTKYNIEYLWLNNGKRLQIEFRPVVKKSEVVVTVVMEISTDFDMEP